MDRVILHSDMNHCYAAIELLHHPELRGRPMAVGGDPEARHGIVLAKSPEAKKAGVQTGMALWQAREVCPEIVFVPPHMDLYLRFSHLAHEIYSSYTDLTEPFGIDESWLDVTASCTHLGDGPSIAAEISRRMKQELGITVSIGVSWNKIFAKFGSDYRKPDVITVISRDNYQDIVWSAPVGDLLYVGPATRRKLALYGIHTIGDLARTDPRRLEARLGRISRVLCAFAGGMDQTPVAPEHTSPPIRSIGNSVTTPRDLVNEDDVRIIVYLLAESVAARLRENGLCGCVVEISIRDTNLVSVSRQCTLSAPTQITGEIAEAAMQLFGLSWHWHKPIRSLGVHACSLVCDGVPVQTDLYHDETKRLRQHRADQAIDDIRKRFGFYAVQRGMMYQDKDLARVNAREEHTVHPHGYMERGNLTGAYDLIWPEVSGGRSYV